MNIHVFWVNDHTATQIATHTHDFYQLVFCKKGTGKILIDNVTYDARDGYVYFAPPGITHGFPDAGDMQIMEIKFVAEGEIAEKLNNLPGVFSINNIPFALELLETTVREGLAGDIYFQECSNYSLRLFFISMLKIFSKSTRSDKTKKSTNLKIPECIGESNDIMILNLRHYMVDHLAEDITLDMLAKSVHFNKSYLVRRFKLLLGESPMKYLNILRIEQAKQLLKQTDMPISLIAEKTGFQSPHYFSRFFKTCEGISPKTFREKK